MLVPMMLGWAFGSLQAGLEGSDGGGGRGRKYDSEGDSVVDLRECTAPDPLPPPRAESPAGVLRNTRGFSGGWAEGTFQPRSLSLTAPSCIVAKEPPPEPVDPPIHRPPDPPPAIDGESMLLRRGLVVEPTPPEPPSGPPAVPPSPPVSGV